MLLGSFVTAIVAYVGLSMLYKMQRMIPQVVLNNPEFVNDYRMEAMTQAINRLKELKAKGAISDEEYYETLNKILES